MINLRSLRLALLEERAAFQIGTIGYLAIFLWSLIGVMLAPPERSSLVAGLCLVVAGLVYPRSLQRVFCLRWLILLGLLALPPVLFLGEVDSSFLGMGYSAVGLKTGAQIALRAIVVLVAVDGFTASVDIASIAGLLERFGLQGLGFSIGVALNLLPCLQQSSTNAWHSLRMRGGLRKQCWRGLRLLAITVVSNALRRAEEIALVAESRAFSPERSRPLPLKASKWDRLISIAALVSGLSILLIR